MAAKQKYDTIEEVVAATGVELNEKTRPFLESFVKKAASAKSESTSNKKKELLAAAANYGMDGLDPEVENATTLLIKIINFLQENGRTEEVKEFASQNNLHVTDEGHIHRIRQSIKPIEQRNAGVKEGSVGYNTIQLLKDPQYAGLTATEVAMKQAEVYGQNTTAACVQWYINYCNKRKAAAEAEGNADAVEEFTICARQRVAKSTKASGGSVALGAELTMEKALKPRGFAKKKAEGSDLGESMQLD